MTTRPAPRYKRGDQVEIVRELAPGFGVGTIATVDMVSTVTGTARYRLAVDGRLAWATERDLGFRQLDLFADAQKDGAGE